MIHNPTKSTRAPRNHEWDLQAIYENCVEEGECFIWKGATSGRGYPAISINGEHTTVRRVVSALAGKPSKPGQPTLARCGNRMCCNADHLTPSTTRNVLLAASKNGTLCPPTKGAKIASVMRRSGRVKLTLEDAKEIRQRTDTSTSVALEYGVTHSIISRIRSGEIWKEYGNSNPFAGLMPT